jgi:ribosomal protein S19
VAGAPNFAREFLVPHYKKLEADGAIGSARFTIPCPITQDEIFMFSESTTELEDLSENVLRKILRHHGREVAITPKMIEDALDDVPNPKHFSRLAVKRSLIKTGHIAKDATLKCRTTKKKNTGHRILKFSEPEPDDLASQSTKPSRPFPDETKD